MFPYIMYIKIKDALFVAGKGNREGELMNKTKIIFFSALLMCFSLTTQTEAKILVKIFIKFARMIFLLIIVSLIVKKS